MVKLEKVKEILIKRHINATISGRKVEALGVGNSLSYHSSSYVKAMMVSQFLIWQGFNVQTVRKSDGFYSHYVSVRKLGHILGYKNNKYSKARIVHKTKSVNKHNAIT